MADFIYKISPNIVLGPYTASRIPQYAKEWGSRFMVVMDPILKEVNLADKILQPLKERQLDYFVFDDLHDGANTEEVTQALTLARQGYVRGIIAVGGARALHAGAAVAALFHEEQAVYAYVEGAAPASSPLPLICIPTTIRAPYVFTGSLPLIDSRSRLLKLLKTQSSVCKLVLWAVS